MHLLILSIYIDEDERGLAKMISADENMKLDHQGPVDSLRSMRFNG